jgi:integrase
VHPPYYAYVHTLFWTGMRPSEAAGLHWDDVDLMHGTLRIVRSRHLGQECATKTRAAVRIVELMPHTVEILLALQPLHVRPDSPVFTNLEGEPIEPKAFSTHWYSCLRALGLPIRGLYATKDSYVSLAMSRGVDPV